MRRSARAIVGCAALTAALLAGCSSSVSGHGGQAVTGPSSGIAVTDRTTDAPPSDSTAPDGSPSAPSSTPSTSAPVSVPVSVPTSASAPPPVPPPASCPVASCPVAAEADAGDGYHVLLRGNGDYGGGVGITVLELTLSGSPVFWATRPGETPFALGCAKLPKKTCIAVDDTGAHGSVGRLWKVVGSTLVAGGTANADTPETHAKDLNGDGYIDVYALQNNYNPDYATGKVFWQTWASNGTNLTSTGCGPTASSIPPRPTTLLTGSCG